MSASAAGFGNYLCLFGTPGGVRRRRRPSSVVRRRRRRRRLPTLQRHTTRPLSKHAPVVTALVEGLCDLATEEAISQLQVMHQSCSVPIDDI